MNKQRLEQLAALTGEVALGLDTEASPASPRRGDLYVLEGSGEADVEWLVIDDAPDAEGRLLAVAADTRSLRGSADVAIDDEGLGPLSVRCGVSSRVHVDPELCTGRVSERSLARVDEVRAALAAGAPLPASTARAQDTDEELVYRQWIAEVEKTRDGLEAAAPAVPERSRRGFRRFDLRGLGALAALVVGAVAVSFFWRPSSSVDELAGPVVNPPLALLAPSSAERGVSQSLRVPAEAPFVVVILGLGDASAFERYRLEVKDPETSEVTWSSSELVRTEVAELSVALPLRMVVGEHTLVLHGLRGDQAELLAHYGLNVELVADE